MAYKTREGVTSYSAAEISRYGAALMAMMI